MCLFLRINLAVLFYRNPAPGFAPKWAEIEKISKKIGAALRLRVMFFGCAEK
jgi:hypothetical protein